MTLDDGVDDDDDDDDGESWYGRRRWLWCSSLWLWCMMMPTLATSYDDDVRHGGGEDYDDDC